MMTIRYLYGKRKFLEPIIKGKAGLRLSDITHYSRMENERMRDNEMEKKFSFDRRKYSFVVAGRQLDPEDMTEDPVLTVTPRHCYCICFTNRKDEIELYDMFDADICVGFDVDMLRERIKTISELLEGIEFFGKDVVYFDPRTPPNTFTREELVFYKPSTFSHESEYRLAMFYPENKKGFKTEDGQVLPFWMEGESMHITINNQQDGFISGCVTEVFYRKK